MNLKNTILSYFLILSYTLSFSHSLIPHSDVLIDGQHTHDLSHNHNHSHSHSTVHSHSTENHVLHEDHLDESFYDYILCIFSDLEHGESEWLIDHEVPTQQNNSSFFILSASIPSAHFFSIETIFDLEKKTIIYSDFQLFYTPPINSSHSLRGPPALSLT